MNEPTALFDRKAYQLARGYLPNLGIPGVTDALIEKYLIPDACQPSTMTELYQRMLEHAQNANMKSGVIGKAIGGVGNLAVVLEGFDPAKVLASYGEDEKAVLNAIETTVKPNGQMRRTTRSLWPQYCRTILSAARFCNQFKTTHEFYDFVSFFVGDERARASLPMLLSKEIHGFGFALACDFLKELGYVSFPKPDVHLRHIFTALHLCANEADDYDVFKAIIRVAGHAGATPYAVDKTFWLIGSGFFYRNRDTIGKDGKIGSHKDDFIAYAKMQLSD